jgi:hypothetical protein
MNLKEKWNQISRQPDLMLIMKEEQHATQHFHREGKREISPP